MNTYPYSVSIVIPNWNGVELLKKNLPVVLLAADKASVVVVDDASTDGSRELIQEHFPQVRLISRKQHGGFAKTVNTGVSEINSELVVLLNSDVRPTKDFLRPLISHFNDPTVFAVGCLDISKEGKNDVLRGRGEGTWKKGFFIHRRGDANESDTAWVSGGSGAFRKNTWDILGGLDELYSPFYWEDIDLSYRAVKSGYRLVFEAKSKVYHYHEEGKILKEFSSREIKRIAYRNQFIFIWKNLSDIKIAIAHIIWTPIRLCQALLKGETAMTMGFIAALMRLPLVMTARISTAKRWKKSDREVVEKYRF